MTPIDLVRLTALRDRTGGSPDVVVGFIDGPVAGILSAKRASGAPSICPSCTKEVKKGQSTILDSLDPLFVWRVRLPSEFAFEPADLPG